ncbi:hypothetical protein [Nostoc sp.]
MSDFLYHPTKFIFFHFQPFLRWAVLRVVGAGDRLSAIGSPVNYLLTIYWMQRVGSYVILD